MQLLIAFIFNVSRGNTVLPLIGNKSAVIPSVHSRAINRNYLGNKMMGFRFFLENCGPVAVTCNSESSAYILFLLQDSNLKVVHYSTSL